MYYTFRYQESPLPRVYPCVSTPCIIQPYLTGHVETAGAVGPYGSVLRDGSEYSGHYADTMTEAELMEWHRPKLQALAETGVDYLALETIPAQKEAVALCKLLREFPHQKAWLSFSCKVSENM